MSAAPIRAGCGAVVGQILASCDHRGLIPAHQWSKQGGPCAQKGAVCDAEQQNIR